VYRRFPTLAAAKAWRADAHTAIKAGTMRAPTRTTLRQAWAAWLAGARDGTIRARGGQPFKPSTLRGYEAAMAESGETMRALGAARLSRITRQDVQALADRMLAVGADPSTIRNALMPLRAVFRRALRDGVVAVNPTTDLELPRVTGRRDRIAAPAEAVELLAALPETDRAVWATALYAGLRAGELMALRWSDVDLAAGLIHVRRAYDPKAHEFVAPKSRAGARRVPIAALLRDVLLEHKLRQDYAGEALAFPRPDRRPFSGSALRQRALTAWAAETARRREEDETAPALRPITLHECRHTFASLMIAAGVNAKALSTFMGHSSITITLDRYGHLFPGSEDQAAELLDAFLAQAAIDTARAAQLEAAR
jgi:integrase